MGAGPARSQRRDAAAVGRNRRLLEIDDARHVADLQDRRKEKVEHSARLRAATQLFPCRLRSSDRRRAIAAQAEEPKKAEQTDQAPPTGAVCWSRRVGVAVHSRRGRGGGHRIHRRGCHRRGRGILVGGLRQRDVRQDAQPSASTDESINECFMPLFLPVMAGG